MTIAKCLLLSCVLALGAVPGIVAAGATPAPASRSTPVQGFRSVSYKITFVANAPATVRVTGDGDTRLSLSVYDSAGRKVTGDTSANDVLGVRFTPRATATYTVRVSNHGGVPNRFSLRTN